MVFTRFPRSRLGSFSPQRLYRGTLTFPSRMSKAFGGRGAYMGAGYTGLPSNQAIRDIYGQKGTKSDTQKVQQSLNATPPATPSSTTYSADSFPEGQPNVLRWTPQIQRASQELGVPFDLLAAVMEFESGGNPSAESPAGAYGLMQVMPNYHSGRAGKYGGGLDDPQVNILVGAEILRENYNRAKEFYGSDDDTAWDIAARAYLGDWNWKAGQSTGAADAHGTTGNIYSQRIKSNRPKYQPKTLTAEPQKQETLAPLDGSTASTIVNEGAKYLGQGYVWGGETPEEGFDCSGLTQWSYKQAGINLPRTAQLQYNATYRVDTPQVGDLVFFQKTYNDPNDWVTHVGIYIGDNKMLQSGDSGVSVTDLSLPYWQERFVGYGRVG